MYDEELQGPERGHTPQTVRSSAHPKAPYEAPTLEPLATVWQATSGTGGPPEIDFDEFPTATSA